MQLDTGCEGSFLYGDRLAQFGVDIDSGVIDCQVFWYAADSAIGTSRLATWWRDDDPPEVDTTDTRSVSLGTIGSGLFQNRILLIDYPNERFAIFSDTTQLPEQLLSGMSFVPAEVVGNMFVISVRLGEDSLHSVMFDTGASDFLLLLSENEWKKYSGYKGDEPEVLRDSVISWGNYIARWRAPSKLPLYFGDLRIDHPPLDCVQWPTPREDDFRLMGNAMFYDDYTILLDFANSRMGISRNDP
ncbi:MAG: hypothetical protein P1R58_12090 [bacterium]|nr:hypothetical protein [bacterium]